MKLLSEPSTGHRSVLSSEKAQLWSALGEKPRINERAEEETSVFPSDPPALLRCTGGPRVKPVHPISLHTRYCSVLVLCILERPLSPVIASLGLYEFFRTMDSFKHLSGAICLHCSLLGSMEENGEILPDP